MTRVCALALALAVTACGSEEPADNAHANHHTSTTNGTNTVAVYVDGLMEAGEMGRLQVMLTADPAPPDVGDNTWTLRIVDMDDNPIDEAKVTATPYMPLHGHGTSPADYTATFSEDGTYVVGPFDLFMPGVWETTIKIEGDVDDSVMYAFELEG